MPLIRLGKTGDASGAGVTLFTVDPSLYSFVTVKSIIVTNRGSNSRSFTIAHVTGAGAATTADYWFFATPLVPNQTLPIAMDAGLNPSDTVFALASANDVTIQLYGEK
jgi:hypothetical protein